VIRLDAATVLLQWASGGLFFLWFTTRRREVSLGYGWSVRGVFIPVAVGALIAGARFGAVPVREVASAGVALAATIALAVSIARRAAGVSGRLAEHDRRTARIASMTGIERVAVDERPSGREFPPALDLVAPAIGVVGLLAAGAAAADGSWDTFVSLVRTLAGAAFLGAITDAMLLGHWYLVQPGLPRRLLNEVVDAVGYTWPFEVGALLLPIGMFSVFAGNVDDGWGGQRDHHDRPRVRHQGGAARAFLLGGDGRHRPAVPGDPHRVRHRPRGPRRPIRLTHGAIRVRLWPCLGQCGAEPSASG
jgi:hypothetical protein